MNSLGSELDDVSSEFSRWSMRLLTNLHDSLSGPVNLEVNVNCNLMATHEQ